MSERLKIGLATVIHGDAYDVLRDVRPADFGLQLIDPMYGKAANAKGKSTGRGGNVMKGLLVEINDWDIDEDATPFDPTPFNVFRKSIMWGAENYAHLLPPHPKWFVWNKRPNAASDDNSDCELAWTNLPGKAIRKYDQLWRGVCRSGRENASRSGPKLHPYQKPVGLGKFCVIQAKLKPGERVIDFFGGSGAFAVAALEMGHPVTIVEKERHFFEVICEQVERAQMQTNMLHTPEAAA